MRTRWASLRQWVVRLIVWLRFDTPLWRLLCRLDVALARHANLRPPGLRAEAALESLMAGSADVHAGAPRFEPCSLLLVCGTLGSGGAERQLVNTAVGIHRRGDWRVSVLFSSLGSPAACFFVPELEAAGITVHDLPRSPVACEAKLVPPGPIARAAFGLSRNVVDDVARYAACFRRHRPEVVHAWLDEINVKAGLGAVLAGVPGIVLGTRSVAPVNFRLFRRYMRAGYQVLLERHNVVLLNNSDAGAASYADWLRVPGARLRVVRNGVAASRRPTPARVSEWRRAAGLPGDGPVVGTIARFFEEKQPLLWLRVAANVARARPDAAFLMVGDGPLRAAARRFAERAGFVDRLVFMDTARDVSLPLACMTVFLLTSRVEGTPNVVLEAHATGCAVVATRGGGTEEAVAPPPTGRVCRSNDPVDIADVVLDVLGDDGALAQARRDGPAFVRSRFGVGRMLEEMTAVYAVVRAPGAVAVRRDVPSVSGEAT